MAADGVADARMLIRYLLGDDRAILDLARGNRLLLGFVLVLSAGVAREYDGGRPAWHLLVPAASSLVASYALFLVAYGGLRGHASRAGRRPPPFLASYRAFLGLFWMTAPLAWFYAVPYERFLSEAGAMKVNLVTLAVVSIWRVWVMARVLRVLMGYRGIHAWMIVMAFADSLVLVALFFVPVPLIVLMGGVQLSEGQQVLQIVSQTVCWIGILTLPIWITGAVLALRRGTPEWKA